MSKLVHFTNHAVCTNMNIFRQKISVDGVAKEELQKKERKKTKLSENINDHRFTE